MAGRSPYTGCLTGSALRRDHGKRLIDEHIVAREVLDLTVTIDHNVVDGAPATRFGTGLRPVMESAAALAPAVRRAP